MDKNMFDDNYEVIELSISLGNTKVAEVLAQPLKEQGGLGMSVLRYEDVSLRELYSVLMLIAGSLLRVCERSEAIEITDEPCLPLDENEGDWPF